MKKLKLTINGKVKTFDLPENEEYKCEVTESYEPKEGDCVMIECNNLNTFFYWFKVKNAMKKMVDFSLVVGEDLKVSKKGFFSISEDRIYTKITPEELKAKYAEAGYDWDYETDTIKPLKWKPKDGEIVWYLLSDLSVIEAPYNNGYYYLLTKGLLFQTKEECQKFADHCLSFFDKKNK